MTPRLAAALTELGEALLEEASARNVSPAPERLLDVDEAAALLGIKRTAAYGELQAGRLASLKIGKLRRIPASAIATYIADRQAKA